MTQPAEGAAYTYKYKQACNGSCKGSCDFCHNFTLSKTISKLPWTKLWYSHSVLSSCSNNTIFYCPQVQHSNCHFSAPDTGMGKRVQINSFKNSFPERVTCIPKQPSFVYNLSQSGSPGGPINTISNIFTKSLHFSPPPPS